MQYLPFDKEDDLVGDHRHQHQNKKPGEDAGRIELATGAQHVSAKPAIGTDQFAYHRADKRETDADAQ
jgi:hypothetical protein